MESKHRILLKDGSTGIMNPESIDFRNPDLFLGEYVDYQYHDQNGMVEYGRHILAEVLDVGLVIDDA